MSASIVPSTADYQLFDALPADVESALRASIERFGVLVPIVTDQHGNVIDGHHRKRIADEAKVKYRVDVVAVAGPAEARELARTLNADRRQLTDEQRRAAVAGLRGQGHSVRAIADALGVGKSTVGRDMAELSHAGQLTDPDRVTGRDGKSRPARRPLLVAAPNASQAAKAREALAKIAEADAEGVFTAGRTEDARGARKLLDRGGPLDPRQLRNTAAAAVRSQRGYGWEGRDAEAWHQFVAEHPEVERFSSAWHPQSTRTGLSWTRADPYIAVCDLAETLPGQDWHWPRYTGQRHAPLPSWPDDEDLSTPLFAPDEWQAVTTFDERRALADLDFDGVEHFSWRGRPPWLGCPLVRRDYDPRHGAAIVPHEQGCGCGLPTGRSGSVFVRRGWGRWWEVEFNDGDGSRTRRRYFVHDSAAHGFVEHAFDVVDPLAFTSENLREVQAEVFQAMPVEWSWFYIRHRTVDRDSAVTALETALDRLRALEPLDPDELHDQGVRWLQDFTPVGDGSEWREGVSTEPRRDDGTVDDVALRAIWGDAR